MNTTPDTRHLDTAIAILGGGKRKPSLAAAKKAAKAPSEAKVLKLDATTGQMKAVPAKKTAARAQALAEVEEDLIGTPAPKKAPAGPRAGNSTTAVTFYPTALAAAQAAMKDGRDSTAVLKRAEGKFSLGSRRSGLSAGYEFIGRAAAVAKNPG